jgi:hypothetical protein
MAADGFDFRGLVIAGRGLSHSDIVRACDEAMKDAVLRQEEHVTEAGVVEHLKERATGQLRLV